MLAKMRKIESRPKRNPHPLIGTQQNRTSLKKGLFSRIFAPFFCSHEWEHIPKEIIEPDDEGWETVGKNRSNKLVSSMPSTPKELVAAEESLEVISEDVVSIADVPEVVVQDCGENDQPCHQDAANQDVEKVGSEKEPSAKEATEDKSFEVTIAASSENSVISQVQSMESWSTWTRRTGCSTN